MRVYDHFHTRLYKRYDCGNRRNLETYCATCISNRDGLHDGYKGKFHAVMSDLDVPGLGAARVTT